MPPVKFFPIINQESRLVLEACQGPNGSVTLAEFNGRDNQLWSQENDLIICKMYPKKVLTLDENWIRRGWGKVHIQTRHFNLEAQKWKVERIVGRRGEVTGYEILSLCVNPKRLDRLKLMIAGRPGMEVICSKMHRGSQQKWLFEPILRQNSENEAQAVNSSLVASNGTITPLKARTESVVDFLIGFNDYDCSWPLG